MRTIMKQDRGVAGLTILLSIVTTLFVIGLLVMIYSLMGGELQEATYTTTSATVGGEAMTEADFVNASKGYTLALSTAQDFASPVITAMYNATTLLSSGNYTLTGNNLFNATSDDWTTLTVNYTYTYGASNGATDVMNDTVAGISGVTDWFPIFIVISAMIVLILLTVIIITAIRGSGMMEGSA